MTTCSLTSYYVDLLLYDSSRSTHIFHCSRLQLGPQVARDVIHLYHDTNINSQHDHWGIRASYSPNLMFDQILSCLAAQRGLFYLNEPDWVLHGILPPKNIDPLITGCNSWMKRCCRHRRHGLPVIKHTVIPLHWWRDALVHPDAPQHKNEVQIRHALVSVSWLQHGLRSPPLVGF